MLIVFETIVKYESKMPQGDSNEDYTDKHLYCGNSRWVTIEFRRLYMPTFLHKQPSPT